MDYQLKKILHIQSEMCKKNEWEEVEQKIGIIFPDDYKMFIDLYGEGGINNFLWILSPFSENENLNSIEKFTVMKEAYISMKGEFPQHFPLDFYNDKEGLFPWGITDNGDELFWNYKSNIIEIVVYESRYAKCMRYAMSMESFLCGLLSKKIVCPVFPNDFVLEKNFYNGIQ